MKTLFFGLMLLATTSLFAQDNDDRNRNNDRNAQNTVPENVQRTFQNDHPDTRDARWQNENGQWHAPYRDRDDKNYDAYYDNVRRRIDRRMDRGDYNQPQLPYKLKRRLDRHMVQTTALAVWIGGMHREFTALPSATLPLWFMMETAAGEMTSEMSGIKEIK
jgi:hypothetical protein